MSSLAHGSNCPSYIKQRRIPTIVSALSSGRAGRRRATATRMAFPALVRSKIDGKERTSTPGQSSNVRKELLTEETDPVRAALASRSAASEVPSSRGRKTSASASGSSGSSGELSSWKSWDIISITDAILKSAKDISGPAGPSAFSARTTSTPASTKGSRRTPHFFGRMDPEFSDAASAMLPATGSELALTIVVVAACTCTCTPGFSSEVVFELLESSEIGAGGSSFAASSVVLLLCCSSSLGWWQ
mmetsp:Transcript_52463/g.111797  ORF Transcript_52463/g.111797 Transcript_52463/m.111797 type:complete len:246 (-) Transcript_52463:191-928(-)